MKRDSEYYAIYRAFRDFLRNEKGMSTGYINTLTSAAELHLPTLLQRSIDPLFSQLYNEEYELSYLIPIRNAFQSNQELIVEPHGYASLESLKNYIEFLARLRNIDLSSVDIKENIGEDKDNDYCEGGVIDSHGVSYERSPALRAECIDKYGCKCFVCGFDFEKVYGEAGHGFIEVHHLTPLNVSGCSHTVTVDDLRPLCSNCHSIIHRRENGFQNPFTIDELKGMINL